MNPGRTHEPDPVTGYWAADKYPFVPVTFGDDLAPSGPAADDGPAQAGQARPDGGHRRPPKPRKSRPPGRIRVAARGTWAQHRQVIIPFAWIPAVDGAAWAAHQMAVGNLLGYSRLAAVLTAVGGGLAAEVATEIRNHRRKRADRWKLLCRRQITAATLWALIAAAWTPAGWQDIVQWVALIGGIVLAGTFVHEIRKAGKLRPPRPAQEPLAIEPPRRPDPRLEALTARFCQDDGPLAGVVAERFRDLPHGFMFELVFPAHTRHSIADVENLRVLIAKLYDVTRDDVTVGYVPDNRSEGRCQVVIRTAPVLTARDRAGSSYNRWDGSTTYDPEQGTIGLGRFLDDAVAHYLLHTPGSGACAGIVAGAPGSCKTGTLHVVAADAGQATLCSRCGARGDCGRCDPQRVVGLFMADPQEQGFSVWKGRADLTGWGPEGCLELLEFTDAVAQARTGVLSSEEWYDTGPDGQPRRNTGRGWFDLRAGFPLLLFILDELPKLAKHPDADLARAALRIIVDGIMEWRKVGIHLLVAAQMLDTSQIGVREIREMMRWLNSIAHRTDEVSTSQGGITGDPRALPRANPATGFAPGYISSIDGRPGDMFATKVMPETLRPGMAGLDIRHLAGLIAGTPIAYDPGTLAVMEAWGVTHQQVFTEWRGRPGYGDAAEPGPEASPAETPAAPAGQAAAAGPGIGGLAYREDAEQVLAALAAQPGAEVYDLMQATGLSLAAVGRSLDALTQNGQAVRTGADQYTAA
ncbi:MAG: hypothetical protein ACRDRJ_38315 [Streptosporangiaceae bacterium]